ncbi:type II toxin-antitoxin system HicB family antitoxin [Acinetobacter guillouiae]|uniref:type II toxin-antitoxin system HicB family antitoxin n=1 Tax=Acinetobacter guillouiae TaxID=106649 RepID=UPI002FD898F0
MSENLLTYKGYYGSYEVCLEDGLIFGKILFIDDSVGYDSESIKGIQAAFEEAVDSYIEFCKEIGKDPNPSFSGKTAVRFDPELHKKVAIFSKKEKQSMNDFIVTAIKNHIDFVENGSSHIKKFDSMFSQKFENMVFVAGQNTFKMFSTSDFIKSNYSVEGKGVKDVTFS